MGIRRVTMVACLAILVLQDATKSAPCLLLAGAPLERPFDCSAWPVAFKTSSQDAGRQVVATPIAPRLKLAALRQIRLPDVRINSVTHHAANEAQNVDNLGRRLGPIGVAHVDVEGVIGGTIRFELLLPSEWNGRFVMGGGGGFVGRVANFARHSINDGYATAGTDTGHQGPSGTKVQWALDNVEAQVNFGHVAVHRTAEVAKAIISTYYAAEPKYSYFSGCSTGGGQALIEAQRYPDDLVGN